MSQVFDHCATGEKPSILQKMTCFLSLCQWQDLNPQPCDFESSVRPLCYCGTTVNVTTLFDTFPFKVSLRKVQTFDHMNGSQRFNHCAKCFTPININKFSSLPMVDQNKLESLSLEDIFMLVLYWHVSPPVSGCSTHVDYSFAHIH